MKIISYGLLTFITISLLSTQIIGQGAHRKIKSQSVDTLNYVVNSSHTVIEFSFLKGKEFNHPTFALWIENADGKYLETIFVTKSIATAKFGHADAGDGTWKSSEGETIRPAALPYWAHKRNVLSRDSIYVPTPENPVTDAISGATPTGSFVLMADFSAKQNDKIKILFEINQPWDWNDFWTNNKYPGDKDYQSSSQPSVIYEATITLNGDESTAKMEPIGHGHYSGKDGSLNEDLSTLTTALEIANQIIVTLIQK